MRSYLVFILALALSLFNFSPWLKTFVYAQNSGQIQITAYVPEHISFEVTAGEIEASTNIEGGLWVLGGEHSISGDIVEVKIDDDRALLDIIIISKI